MVIVDSDEQIDLLAVIKGVLPSELERFTRSYIVDHVYITLKDISWSYINTYYRIPLRVYEREKLIHTLNRKLGKIVMGFIQKGILERYNTKTYRKIAYNEMR